jgi:hypothetical protein
LIVIADKKDAVFSSIFSCVACLFSSDVERVEEETEVAFV